jgi:hypothetical protein
VFDKNEWSSESELLDREFEQPAGIAIDAVQTETRDEGSQIAVWLPALLMLVLILLSPFLYDGISALIHIP